MRGKQFLGGIKGRRNVQKDRVEKKNERGEHFSDFKIILA